MRSLRIAVLFAVVVSPVLPAQQAPRQSASTAGPLAAEVHYTDGGDAWFATTKPAYIALFDVSRNGVRQIYPTFSAQVTELSGTSGRINMRATASLGGSAWTGGSSLVTLNTPTGSAGASAWPHTLLLVASTAPLRIGSSWTSNIALNHDLFREHHWNDLETDAGIAAIVGVVRPLDPAAEVALDRVQASTPALYTASLAYDPNRVALAYSCVDGTSTFVSAVALLGATCVPMREFPGSGPAAASTVAAQLHPAGTFDTTHAAQSRVAAPGGTAASVNEKKHGDYRSISDPAEIKAFIESMKSNAGEATDQHRDRNGISKSERTADGIRRWTDEPASSRGQGAPAVHSEQATHRSSNQPPARPAPTAVPATPKTFTAPSPQAAPAPAPVKPPNERQ